MSTITSTLLLKDFCKLLEKISNLKNKQQKTKELSNYINKFKDNVQKANLDLKDNCSFFPIMRLLVPRLDRERGAYGIKEATLAKIYIHILGLSKDGTLAQKLLNFRAPQYSGQSAGDFADVAYWVLQGRAAKGGIINIDDLNQHFDKIADLNAANDPRGIDIELTALLQKTSQLEQKWIIRMLLKNITIGIGHNKILNLWHPDGVELFDVCNNLLKVCERLTDCAQRLHEIEVSVFEPYRPMLANRCNILTVEKCLKNQDHLYVETKYDGERFQLHMRDGVFKYFSRGAFEYTNTFGANKNQGLLTPLIAQLIDSKCRECILDGEMMGWDNEHKLFKTKGNTFDVKKLKPGDKYNPCFCIYDILLYNSEVLTNQPYIERVQLLEKIVTPNIGVVQLTKRYKVKTSQEITSHLNDAIDKHLEGIVIKEPKSIYKPNARTAGWYKIKPEYTEGLMDHLDLIIIGGYYGEGKRRGTISHFLLGLRDNEKFLSFCKVGSGYSHSELAELTGKLLPNWKNLKYGQVPASNLVWTREKPDVWIADKDSFILEVKATEICRSKDFAVGFTLRFPRVQQIRYEKKTNECMTHEQFYELYKEAQGKLYSRHVPIGLEDGPLPAKRRKQIVKRMHPVPSEFRLNVNDPSIKVQRLHSKEFCIVSDTSKHSKSDIEKQIIENGGKITQNPGKNTLCLIVGDITFRVKTLIKSNKYDMVRMEWLLRFLNDDDESIEEPDWTPFDMIYALEKTKENINIFYDEYGDNFRIPATLESLKKCMNHMESKSLTQNKISELDIEVFYGYNPFSIFRLCTALIEEKEDNFEIDWIANDFVFQGGIISKELNDHVTHVILSSSDKILYWKNINDNRLKKLYIVRSEWVQESCHLKTRLEEHDFIVKNSNENMIQMEIDEMKP